MPDPDIPESIKSKKGFNGVLWSDACRARLIEPKTERLETPIPRFLWAVPGCIYVSGQFNELVEPLGNEPIVTLTLWLPARCIQEASLQSKAAGRMWLISLQCALESPFFGAALAGCRWESAFFASSSEAGMRLCFQGFCDNLPSFATDVAAAIGAHSGPTNGDELELVRRLALAELQTGKTRRDGASDLRSCLQQIKIGDIQKECSQTKALDASYLCDLPPNKTKERCAGTIGRFDLCGALGHAFCLGGQGPMEKRCRVRTHQPGPGRWSHLAGDGIGEETGIV